MGIKNANYTSSGTNGQSHRKNSLVKKSHYLTNKKTRAEINQNKSRMSDREYHAALDGFSPA